MQRRAILLVTVLLIAGRSPVLACSARQVQPGERFDNPSLSSRNGTYCAEVHVWRGVGGCGKPNAAWRWNREHVARPNENFFPPPIDEEEDDSVIQLENLPTIVYRGNGDGHYEQISSFVTPRSGDLTFISEDGDQLYIERSGCNPMRPDSFAEVRAADGKIISRTTIETLLHPDDAMMFGELGAFAWSLERDNTTGQRLLTLRITRRNFDRDPGVAQFDADRGIVLQRAPQMLPPFEVHVSASMEDDEKPRHCYDVDGIDRGEEAISVSSRALLARARDARAPAYPSHARKMRVTGTVDVDIVISAEGRVLCAQALDPGAFGLREAALETVRTWTFDPHLSEGRAVSMRGTVAIRFDRPTRDEWIERSKGE